MVAPDIAVVYHNARVRYNGRFRLRLDDRRIADIIYNKILIKFIKQSEQLNS